MRNMLRTLERATKENVPLTCEELGTDPSIFIEVANKSGFDVEYIPHKKGTAVRLKRRSIPVVMLYDGNVSKSFNFLDLSDLHVGHPKFNAKELEKILAKYYRNGKPLVDYVFIAGDLLEGITSDYYTYELLHSDKKEMQRVINTRNVQVNTLLNILSKYDFDYRVINGNHDYIYTAMGLESALRILERKMRDNGKRFTFYDTYVVDFIIAGVCKRMMHLESFDNRPGAVPSYDRLRAFKRNGGLYVRYNGKRYPIRFFQCGHLHQRKELYDGSMKVFITQPGSFVKNEMVYSPGILVRGRVLENKNVIRE